MAILSLRKESRALRSMPLRVASTSILNVQHLFHDRPDAEATRRIQLGKRKTKKRPMDSVIILNAAVVAYHLPIRLGGLLVLQSVRRPIGRGKEL